MVHIKHDWSNWETVLEIVDGELRVVYYERHCHNCSKTETRPA